MSLVIIPASRVNAPGLLTAKGWDALREADTVLLTCAHPAWSAHLREAGIEAHGIRALRDEEIVQALVRWCPTDDVRAAWITDSDHPALSAPHELLERAEEALGRRIDADYVFASPEAPGSQVVESVRIAHVLRSPGGDPWSAEQTHASLARYLLEEAHEVLEVLEQEEPNTKALVDEWGDILFQLVVHARIGAEAADPWTLDSVARALNAKMYRRNPHVFSATPEDKSVEEIISQWDLIKRQEKNRASLFHSIPQTLPALQRAFKIGLRARSAGCLEALESHVRGMGEGLGVSLMLAACAAARDDNDPESALRTLLSRLETSESTWAVSPSE